MKNAAAATRPYSASSCTPSNQWDSPSRVIERRDRRGERQGQDLERREDQVHPDARESGPPRPAPAPRTARPGCWTRSAICSARSTFPFRATTTAAACSAALPMIGMMMRPRNASESIPPVVSGSTAPTRISDSTAMPIVATGEDQQRARQPPDGVHRRMRLATEQPPVGAEREQQREEVDHGEDDRRRPPRGAARSSAAGSGWVECSSAGKTSAATARASIAPAMPAAVRLKPKIDSPHPGRHQRQAENQQEVAENAADDGGLDQLDEAGLERDDRDDQFRRVAEGRVEQAADGGAGTLREMFGGFAEVLGERQDGQAGHDEHERRIGALPREPDAGRHRREQEVSHPEAERVADDRGQSIEATPRPAGRPEGGGAAPLGRLVRPRERAPDGGRAARAPPRRAARSACRGRDPVRDARPARRDRDGAWPAGRARASSPRRAGGGGHAADPGRPRARSSAGAPRPWGVGGEPGARSPFFCPLASRRMAAAMPLVSPRSAFSRSSGRDGLHALAAGFRRRLVEDPAGAAREREPVLGRRPLLAGAHQPLGGVVRVLRQERGGLGGEAVTLAQQREQQVFGADLGVAQSLGLFAGGGEQAAGALGGCGFGHASCGEIREAWPRR